MNVKQNTKKVRAFRICLSVYAIYTIAILVRWIIDWHFFHGAKRWNQGWWWLTMPAEMMIPTFPASMSIYPLLRVEPQWFVELLARHPFTAMLLTWSWFALAGYFQWFVVVPRFWHWLRPKVWPKLA